MKIKNVELSILRTELGQEVIPTHGAIDKMPQLVLVSVSTHEGIDGHYISYLIPSTRLTASKLPFTSAEEGGGTPLAPTVRASNGQRLLSLRQISATY